VPLTYYEFMDMTQAELVGGNVITGFGPKRVKLGEVVDGRFELTDDGKRVMGELEAGTYVVPDGLEVDVPVEMPELPVSIDIGTNDKGEVTSIPVGEQPTKRGPGRPPKQQE